VSTTLPADLSCPRCGAHVRTGSAWCTLCYTDLRPADQRPPAPVAEPVAPTAADIPEVPAPDLPTPDLHAAATPTAAAATPDAPVALTPSVAPEQQARGKHAKRAPVASPDETEALAAQLLAQLAVHESANPLGHYAGLADTTGKKALIMILGCAVMIGLLLGGMAVLGVIL
jgi:hypothetical protein